MLGNLPVLPPSGEIVEFPPPPRYLIYAYYSEQVRHQASSELNLL